MKKLTVDLKRNSTNKKPTFRRLNLDEINKINTKPHVKFIFVRDPLERLISAWNDKLRSLNEDKKGWKPFRRWVIHEAHVNDARRKHISYDDRPSLEEFLTTLSHPVSEIRRMDEHWMPISNLCLPCQVDFDYIGSTDDMALEFKFILQKALGDRYPEDLEIPDQNQVFGQHRELLTEINQQVLGEIKSKYSHDLAMFSRQ